MGCWVGVKNVAQAHILGYEKPEAEGRYILSTKVMHWGDFGALLQKLFPQYNVVARYLIIILRILSSIAY